MTAPLTDAEIEAMRERVVAVFDRLNLHDGFAWSNRNDIADQIAETFLATLRGQAEEIGRLEAANEKLAFVAQMNGPVEAAAQHFRDGVAAGKAEATEEIARLTEERDEALTDPWPEWTARIIKTLESFGVEVVDHSIGEIADFGDTFDEWFREGLASETARAEAAEQALAEMAEALEKVTRQLEDWNLRDSEEPASSLSEDGPALEAARTALAQHRSRRHAG